MPERQEGLALPFTRQWFPQVSGRYAISFSIYPRTREVSQTHYPSWLLGRELPLYLITMSEDANKQKRSGKGAGDRLTP